MTLGELIEKLKEFEQFQSSKIMNFNFELLELQEIKNIKTGYIDKNKDFLYKDNKKGDKEFIIILE